MIYVPERKAEMAGQAASRATHPDHNYTYCVGHAISIAWMEKPKILLL